MSSNSTMPTLAPPVSSSASQPAGSISTAPTSSPTSVNSESPITGKAIITLLTSSSYLPGVLVLLHSLKALHPEPRDFKLVCLVTPETVDPGTIGEVRKAGYDLVIGVEGIGSGKSGEEGLGLMGRPDLNLALTKLHLFRLSPLFNTIIYLDADVLPLRPLSHLFESTNPHVLSACSDTGWPDCFNSGVMVIRPRQSDFDGMRNLMSLAMSGQASEGEMGGNGGQGGNGSFDGADQGLLNEWFSEEGGGGDWNRLSFTYNVTPSSAYQYAPAYKRYGHKISCVHFIGNQKPWSNLKYRPAGISNVVGKENAFDYSSLIDKWYNIYDTHVRPTSAHPSTTKVRFEVPQTLSLWNTPTPTNPSDRMDLDTLKSATLSGLSSLGLAGAYISLPLDGRVDLIMPSSLHSSPQKSPSPLSTESPEERQEIGGWDAQYNSPPKKSQPEMSAQTPYYTNAWDKDLSQDKVFEKVEPKYPTLPQSVIGDNWYDNFTKGPAPDSGKIGNVFPWEGKGEQRKAERVWPRGSSPPPIQSQPSSQVGSVGSKGEGAGRKTPSFQYQIPTPPPTNQSMAESMSSYRNAWDSDPSIAAYISKITGGRGDSQRELERGLRSVPATPKYEVGEKGGGLDVGSDGSGDGDDECEEEEEGDSDDNINKGRKSLNPNPKYRDRGGQTEKVQTKDHAGMWGGNEEKLVVPGGGGREREESTSSESTITSLPDNHTSSSTSQTAGTNIQQPIPTMLKPRRISFPRGQPSTDQIPKRNQGPKDRSHHGGPVLTSTLPTGLSPTGKEMPMGGYEAGIASSSSPSPYFGNGTKGEGVKRSIGRRTDSNTSSLGKSSYTSAGSGSDVLSPAGGSEIPKVKASRQFDPNTSIDVRRRDTQEVLVRFMKAGEEGAAGK